LHQIALGEFFEGLVELEKCDLFLKGKFFSAGGSVYEGEFKDKKPNGIGIHPFTFD